MRRNARTSGMRQPIAWKTSLGTASARALSARSRAPTWSPSSNAASASSARRCPWCRKSPRVLPAASAGRAISCARRGSRASSAICGRVPRPLVATATSSPISSRRARARSRLTSESSRHPTRALRTARMASINPSFVRLEAPAERRDSQTAIASARGAAPSARKLTTAESNVPSAPTRAYRSAAIVAASAAAPKRPARDSTTARICHARATPTPSPSDSHTRAASSTIARIASTSAPSSSRRAQTCSSQTRSSRRRLPISTAYRATSSSSSCARSISQRFLNDTLSRHSISRRSDVRRGSSAAARVSS